MFGGFLDMSRSWHARSELSGGGVIADNGPHAFDLVRHLLGPIHSVWARLGRFQPIDVEDIAQVAVVVEDGPAGSIDLSWSVSACPSGYLEIYGSEGSAALDTAGLWYRLNGWSEPKRLANRASTRDAFARQIEYFLGAAAGHDTLGLSAAEGVFAAAAVEAAYESARRGAAVTLDASIEQPEYACSAS
jgi:predicted dehydrogenase